jgi:hypothetical protein
MKNVRVGAAMAAALMAAACGGGGGGASQPILPPPPPSPPAAPNTSLLNLTSSEDFTNVSATGSAIFPKSGTGQTASATFGSATIHYDVGANSYALTTGGRSQTFAPANIDTADSSALATAYLKTNGGTTDSLTLTKPGTSGPLTYKYVGGAFWQRTIDGPSSVSGSLDAIAYGVATLDGAVPRTGTAEYTVDLLGAEATTGGVVGITGTGVTQVDFTRGVLVTHGTAKQGSTPGQFASPFSSEAKLSSNSNNFDGTFRWSDFGDFVGQLKGKFFGPNAEEIGASFFAANGTSRVAVGTILGRGGAVSKSNAIVRSPTVNEFFGADGATLTTSLQGATGRNDGGAGFSSSGTADGALIVNYDATTNGYTLIAPDRSQYFTGDIVGSTTTEKLTDATPSFTLAGFNYATLTNLKYVAAREWFKEERGSPTSRYTIEYFAYGRQTPDSVLPRTGKGDYVIGMLGTAADGDFVNLVNFRGFGFLNVDFATGALTTNGQLVYNEDYIISGGHVAGRGAGTFTGSSQLSSTNNNFTGPIALTGFGNYSGTMNGHFFGPSAEEVGASFRATDGIGGVMAGTFAGGLDAAAAQNSTTLANLPGPTSLGFSEIHYAPFGVYSDDLTAITYDPTTSTYTLSLTDTNLQGAAVHSATLNSSNRDTVASDASYDVFTASLAGEPYRISILKALPSNPTLALSYTSLAEIVGTTSRSPVLPSDRRYVAFGLTTPNLQMPVSGTATYNGVAVGVGAADVSGATHQYDLAGTTSMIVNFATSRFTSTLDLIGSDISSHAARTFSTENFSGDLSLNTFSTHFNGHTYQGKFYGPGAQEIGGIFDVDELDAQGSRTVLQGAFVGKK